MNCSNLILKRDQLLLIRVLKRRQLNLVLKLVFFAILVLQSQSFIQCKRLLQVPDQLLDFESGKDDKVTHTGHLKRSLLHAHRLWTQA